MKHGVVTAALVSALAACPAALAGCSTAQKHSVVFDVTGSGRTATRIEYSEGGRATTVANGALPWQRTAKIDKATVRLTANAPADSTVKCAISVDGRQAVADKSTTGGSATCEYHVK